MLNFFKTQETTKEQEDLVDLDKLIYESFLRKSTRIKKEIHKKAIKVCNELNKGDNGKSVQINNSISQNK